MTILHQYNITASDSKIGDAAYTFEHLFPVDFTQVQYTTPQEYVNMYWAAYQQTNSNSNLNGHVFEYIIETLLIREGIIPFYSQTVVNLVPGISFDVILYSKDEYGRKPYCLSLKTSCRERWKQADLEGEALKHVHRRAVCYLLTMSTSEVDGIRRKIDSGDVFALDKIIDCSQEDINTLIDELKTLSLYQNEKIDVIKGGRLIQ